MTAKNYIISTFVIRNTVNTINTAQAINTIKRD